MNNKAGEEKKDTDIMNEVNRVPMTEESRERMTLNIYDLQYLVRLQDMSNESFRQELQEIYEKDNDQMCKNVVEVIQQELSPINATLLLLSKTVSSIAADISIIKMDIISIKERLSLIESKQKVDENELKIVQERLDKKKQRIEVLETKVDLLQPEPIIKLVKEVHDLKPKIERLNKTQSWWNIGMRIALAVSISTILMLFAIEIHKKNHHPIVKPAIEVLK
jgi:hypothetical protein